MTFSYTTPKQKGADMKKISLVMIGLVIAVWVTSSFGVEPTWQMILGDPQKNQEANYVIPLDKGGYVIAGSVSPGVHGDRDMFIACVTKAGQIAWQKEYGGIYTDYGMTVQPTWDGGYILVGEKSIDGENCTAIYLVKTDKFGDSIWTRTFYVDKYYFGPNAIRATKDSGYIIAGSTDCETNGGYDVHLVKVDAQGNYQWDQLYGGEADDMGNSVELTSDGGYIVYGSSSSDAIGMFDMYIIKTDEHGDTIWTRKMGRVYGDIALSVKETPDGKYIICGETDMMSKTNVASNPMLVKLDKDGKRVWYQEYGGPQNDGFQSLAQTSDKGFAVVGYTNSFGNGSKKDVYLVRTDSLGKELWHKTFGDNSTDYGACIAQTKDNGFIICGTYTSPFSNTTDIYLIRTDAEGNVKQQ